MNASSPKYKVSVIITCYNYGRYLTEAVESVEANTLAEVEIIIVDDGSPEPYTQQVVNKYKEEGYHVICQTNQGVARARNNGIRAASGSYILPLDADNKLAREHLAHAVAILEEKPNVGVVYGNAQLFGTADQLWRNRPLPIDQMILDNQIDTCAVFRREVWEAAGGYDDQAPINTWQDWIFWMDVLIKTDWDFYHLDETTFYYRSHDASELQKNTRKVKRKIIMREYVRTRQVALIEKAVKAGTLTAKEGLHLKKEIDLLLAYYHMEGGELPTAYRYLYPALTDSQLLPRSLRIATATPLKRLIKKIS
ncbi:MAG: glycosyltransferase family A protein [Catalinimonas sp.]